MLRGPGPGAELNKLLQCSCVLCIPALFVQLCHSRASLPASPVSVCSMPCQPCSPASQAQANRLALAPASELTRSCSAQLCHRARRLPASLAGLACPRHNQSPRPPWPATSLARALHSCVAVARACFSRPINTHATGAICLPRQCAPLPAASRCPRLPIT